jgi:DNA mismatch endonuclease (patch repair protein)
MASIKGRDTKPEIVLRKALFALGFRYRLHQRQLPGTPDLVFPKYRAAIFIHGCFWHSHGCKLFVVPETNRDFWLKKLGGNRARDDRAVQALRALGWRVLTVWECGLRGCDRLPLETVAARAAKWLNARKPTSELP